jgi:MFS family permease
LAGLLALVFGLLIATHLIALWMVFVLATGLGLVNVFDNPARQAMIPELVGADQVPNAVMLNSVTINFARIAGAAVGGAAAAGLGLASCFILNGFSYGAVLISLLLMRVSEIRAAPPEPREKGQVRAGLRYVRHTPVLLVALLMVAVVGTLAWEFQVSLPLLAKGVFGGDAATYAGMTAAMGIGAVVGGLVSASRTVVRASGLAVAAIGWGIAITAAALAPTLAIEYVLMLFVGYGSITFNALAKTTLQLAAIPAMRGRVMALWALAWQGSTPIGGPIIGWISQEFGARWSLLAGGLPTVAVGLAAYPVLVRIDRQRPQPPVVARPIEAAATTRFTDPVADEPAR